MVALIFPFVLAASSPFATPPPATTSLPEIGHVTSRASCNSGKKALATVLPILIHNDNTITNAMKGMGELNTRNDAATNLTITRTRTMSSQIFKNLDQAKDQVMKLHVLAAAATNADDSARYTAAADSLDAVVQQQNTIADTFNGYADTADMGILYQGSETERKMAGATSGNDQASIKLVNSRRHVSPAAVDVGALTYNVYRDVQDMRKALDQTEADVATHVKAIVQTCNAPIRKP